jgi:hypothetical protein
MRVEIKVTFEKRRRKHVQLEKIRDFVSGSREKSTFVSGA